LIDSDEALVIAGRSGERGAFEQLVRRTSRLVYARIYLDVGDAHRAEDLVQETYLTAWRSIGGLDDPAKFRPWLLSIAHSVLVDRLRKQSAGKRGGKLADSAALQNVPDSTGTPSETVEQMDQRQRVLAALKELPEDYRQVLMLRYLADADYQTIGRQLAISNGSLRGLLHRGLEMLREKLKD
jgi:RNA polymerase sigma-70 factor, ECF subfamily